MRTVDLYLILDKEKEVIANFRLLKDAETFAKLNKCTIKKIEIEPITLTVGTKDGTLNDVKLAHIEKTLLKNNLSIRKTAKVLGMFENNLRYHLCKYYKCKGNELSKTVNLILRDRMESYRQIVEVRRSYVSKRVVDLNTGYVYNSAKECADKLNVNYKMLSLSLRNNDSKYGVKYE